MPEQVTNWQSTEEECSFTIAGMASLGMKIAEKTPHSLIKVIRNGKAPFDFGLDCIIKESSPGQSSVQLAFDADLNPMMKMMAVKPLTNFLNLLVGKLSTIANLRNYDNPRYFSSFKSYNRISPSSSSTLRRPDYRPLIQPEIYLFVLVNAHSSHLKSAFL